MIIAEYPPGVEISSGDGGLIKLILVNAKNNRAD